MTGTLYDADFHAWTREQAARLRQAAAERVNTDFDWENLAEEIESMGGSERSEIESRLIELLFHLGKLAWSPDLLARGDWTVSVYNQRDAILARLERSPSLRGLPSDILAGSWAKARKRMAASLRAPIGRFPANCPWDLKTRVLDEDWLPDAPATEC